MPAAFRRASAESQIAGRPLSSKPFNPALDGGLIAVGHVHHPDHYQSIERRIVSIRMLLKLGTHASDRVRKVACLDVFKRSSFAPNEMFVAGHEHTSPFP